MLLSLLAVLRGGDADFAFEIIENNGNTEVRFTHVGLVPAFECYDICSNAWDFYIKQSLFDLITTGTGQPTRKAAAA